MKPLALTLLALALAACSHRAPDSATTGQAYVSAIQQMNHHDYEGAIATLEPLAQANPQNREVAEKLMHAYAGAAGFEMINFKNLLERLAAGKFPAEMNKAFLEFKRLHGLTALTHADVLRFYAQVVTQALVLNLADVPQLSHQQYQRLNQALAAYEKENLRIESASKEENFQWGLLYAYRDLVNFRALAIEADRIARDQESRGDSELERRFVRLGGLVISDTLRAYKLFRHSYGKLQEASDKIADFAARVSNHRLKMHVLEQATDAQGVLAGFIIDNRDEGSALLALMAERARNSRFAGDIRSGFGAFANEGADVRFRHARLRAAIRVLLDDAAAGPKAATDLLSEQLYGELRGAVDESLRTGSLDPFATAYRDERSATHRLLDALDALAENTAPEKLRADLRAPVAALVQRVDEQQVAQLGADAAALAGAEKEILAAETTRHREDVEFLRRQLGERAKDLDRQLKGDPAPLPDVNVPQRAAEQLKSL